jgi:magnesium transporter
MYMGDVHGLFFSLISFNPTFKVDGDLDHVLNLQHSLNHLEKILSHSHPAYLNHLRTRLGEARAGLDKAFFGLTAVTGCVALMQIMIGECIVLKCE